MINHLSQITNRQPITGWKWRGRFLNKTRRGGEEENRERKRKRRGGRGRRKRKRKGRRQRRRRKKWKWRTGKAEKKRKGGQRGGGGESSGCCFCYSTCCCLCCSWAAPGCCCCSLTGSWRYPDDRVGLESRDPITLINSKRLIEVYAPFPLWSFSPT